jgi:hypothetical protein
MADIEFNCPHCRQSLEAPEEMFGQQINCPSCGQAVKLPDPQFKNLDVRNKEQNLTHAPPPKSIKDLISREKNKADSK